MSKKIARDVFSKLIKEDDRMASLSDTDEDFEFCFWGEFKAQDVSGARQIEMFAEKWVRDRCRLSPPIHKHIDYWNLGVELLTPPFAYIGKIENKTLYVFCNYLDIM